MVFTLILAVFSCGLAMTGFWVHTWVGGFTSAEAARPFFAMIATQLVVALLWAIAALLLGRRWKGSRALVGALAAGYVALNSFGLNSLFALMVSVAIRGQGWQFNKLLFGDEPGNRILMLGAGLAAVLLVVLLSTAVGNRSQPRAEPGYPYR
ncbi:hypothetical protein [Nocardia salmonicida]